MGEFATTGPAGGMVAGVEDTVPGRPRARRGVRRRRTAHGGRPVTVVHRTGPAGDAQARVDGVSPAGGS